MCGRANPAHTKAKIVIHIDRMGDISKEVETRSLTHVSG